MARYMGRYGRRRRSIRRWVYMIAALVVVIIILGFIFGRNPLVDTEEKVVVAETTTEKGSEVVKIEAAISSPEPNLLKVPEHTAESNPDVTVLIERAIGLIESEPAKIIEARDILNEALAQPQSGEQQQFIKAKLAQLANEWLFSRMIFPEDKLTGSYKVQMGDQLRKIGRDFKVPYEILMHINNIERAEQLQAGQVIKVINGPFHVRVYRSSYSMDLYLQNTYVRSFSVGLGKPGRETPTGLWVVEPGGKAIKPTWRDPDTGKVYESEDPDYPLGSRWIRLKGLEGEALGRTGIAFHGTNDANLIGAAGSRGCIRLYNGDVILLYNLLMEGVSRVEVVD